MSKVVMETGRKSDPQTSMHHLLNVQEADSKRQGKPTKTKRKGKPTNYQEKQKEKSLTNNVSYEFHIEKEQVRHSKLETH